MSVPRLSPALRETALAWHEANPLNSPARAIEIFPGQDREAIRHRARCSKLVEIGALVPNRTDVHERRRLYKLTGWTLADILNPPPTDGGGDAA